MLSTRALLCVGTAPVDPEEQNRKKSGQISRGTTNHRESGTGMGTREGTIGRERRAYDRTGFVGILAKSGLAFHTAAR